MALEHFESMCVHLLHADRVREWQRLMASTIFTWSIRYACTLLITVCLPSPYSSR